MRKVMGVILGSAISAGCIGGLNTAVLAQQPDSVSEVVALLNEVGNLKEYDTLWNTKLKIGTVTYMFSIHISRLDDSFGIGFYSDTIEQDKSVGTTADESENNLLIADDSHIYINSEGIRDLAKTFLPQKLQEELLAVIPEKQWLDIQTELLAKGQLDESFSAFLKKILTFLSTEFSRQEVYAKAPGYEIQIDNASLQKLAEALKEELMNSGADYLDSLESVISVLNSDGMMDRLIDDFSEGIDISSKNKHSSFDSESWRNQAHLNHFSEFLDWENQELKETVFSNSAVMSWIPNSLENFTNQGGYLEFQFDLQRLENGNYQIQHSGMIEKKDGENLSYSMNGVMIPEVSGEIKLDPEAVIGDSSEMIKNLGVTYYSRLEQWMENQTAENGNETQTTVAGEYQSSAADTYFDGTRILMKNAVGESGIYWVTFDSETFSVSQNYSNSGCVFLKVNGTDVDLPVLYDNYQNFAGLVQDDMNAYQTNYTNVVLDDLQSVTLEDGHILQYQTCSYKTNYGSYREVFYGIDVAENHCVYGSVCLDNQTLKTDQSLVNYLKKIFLKIEEEKE